MRKAALVVISVLSCGAALAATDPPRPTTTATPSSASATPVKHTSLKACNKQADAKNLTGPPRVAFIRNCRGGKPSS